ncbi:hypothetical protein [Enterococcus larvae]|uniref:hypothetical protein n=1 Tax=Enterococcus larvae TaxID=2794352 RepID=UPI003F3D2A8B
MNTVSSGVSPQVTAIAAVVAAVISLIGVVLTIVFNVSISKRNNEIQRELAQKNIDANLKAKARIDWITSVREISARIIIETSLIQNDARAAAITHEYLRIALDDANNNVFEDYGGHKAIYDPIKGQQLLDAQSSKKENKQDFISKHIAIFSLCQELLLYFSESTEHEKIIDSIENIKNSNNEIAKMLNEEQIDIDEFKKIEIQYPDLIQVFTKEIKAYLKREWDRAKNGE